MGNIIILKHYAKLGFVGVVFFLLSVYVFFQTQSVINLLVGLVIVMIVVFSAINLYQDKKNGKIIFVTVECDQIEKNKKSFFSSSSNETNLYRFFVLDAKNSLDEEFDLEDVKCFFLAHKFGRFHNGCKYLFVFKSTQKKVILSKKNLIGFETIVPVLIDEDEERKQNCILFPINNSDKK